MFRCISPGKTLAFLDHKIGGAYSSFPEIYNRLVKHQPSRENRET